MLNKLLKYDLKDMFKFLVIFYSIGIFFSILTRIFLNIENSFIMTIIGQICSGVTISMIFNILINNLMRIWVRFKNSFYNDESYLTHTLPIEKNTLYLSKILATIITVFTSTIVIMFMLFIAYYNKENITSLKNMLLPLADIYDTTLVKILFAFFLVFFLEFANILQSGFTGIILGHKMNSGKLGFSVLFGFISYMITQVFAIFMIFIVGLFNENIMNLFHTTTFINVETIKIIIYLAIFIYTVSLIIVYFINQYLFKQGVNVE